MVKTFQNMETLFSFNIFNRDSKYFQKGRGGCIKQELTTPIYGYKDPEPNKNYKGPVMY